MRFINRILVLIWTGALTATLAAQPEGGTPQASSHDPEEVLAEMNGYRLTRQGLQELLAMLPESTRQQMSGEDERRQFIRNWMEIMAFHRRALETRLEETEEFKSRQEFFNKQILAEQYRLRLIEDLEVSTEEVHEYYESNRDRFRVPPAVRVGHILLESREEAEQVHELLQAGGDFEELAAERSADRSSSDQGGDLGWLAAGTAPPQFEQAAFGLSPGEVSTPVETEYGWHVVRVTEKREAHFRSIDEVEQAVRQQLLTRKSQEKLSEASSELFEKYSVKIHDRE